MDQTSESVQLEVIFIPFLAPGHMIPMVNIARLFATHGVNATIITTTFASIQFHKAFTQELKSGNKITIHTVLSEEESASPQGTTGEASFSKVTDLIVLMAMLQPKIEQVIRQRRPHCIVSDMFCAWTSDIAISLGIPRLVFYGVSYLAHCCTEIVTGVPPGSEDPYVIPGLPDKIEFLRSQLHFNVKTLTMWYDFLHELREADKKSFGVLRFNVEKADDVNTDGHNSCLSWLNTKKHNSVMYISFGSMAKCSSAQLLEIASGLEASGHPFIWVVREGETTVGEITLLPEGLEERMTEGDKGLIIKGWAPQMLILEHPAVGGFGQSPPNNSTMKRGKIEKVVIRLMGVNEVADERRKRAKEYGQMAKRAVEDGGSSYVHLVSLIDNLKSLPSSKK
ncbi:hypothetical protein IFM89_037109 [Coptis chinensis]|uniref:Uncharacterized protein n=1 Tax=Coptis chinensis TaxID=261450 RepID=A0A835LQE8_9MAGN|nr:hypothetical protein IFM89_037109 [Coptis chinensis]